MATKGEKPQRTGAGISIDLAQKLYDRLVPQYRAHVEMFCVNPGMKADRQARKTAKEVLAETMMDLIKNAYLSGLDEGYNMGRVVFSPSKDGE